MKRRFFCLISALLFCSAQAHATTIAAFTFDQLCEKAEAVYRAQFVRCRSAWDEAHRTIYTTTTLRVLDPVKGGAQEITLRLPGGTVNDSTLTIPDFPVFQGDDEMVIFLTGRDGAGYPWPVGMGQGIYPVFRDAAGRPKVALRPGLNPSPLAKPAPGGAAPETIPLDDFLNLVRARVGGTAPARPGAAGSQ
ncbi:MAG: hypothetical protein A3F84_13885 [Candidatus Handelsmanbacteria bacterium RIFCSPLOWO2_12_FULL_64_10]|uniref:Uncharacterized protein n=1 Tax=Handelsmanbacteria sp. (strain RIFCSPLOWO2_12_FULL_64_10) TaxID=1817868 RepID=A0A1F6CDS1_HANXR|nr:MAG: hypothetical protein A3F84_13885 [Candidatus Handelsmanbacteria bacterium RIFCSPLOWO2_12_FULL_64_10]